MTCYLTKPRVLKISSAYFLFSMVMIIWAILPRMVIASEPDAIGKFGIGVNVAQMRV